jgi:membrane-bound lytic murein transglycosylase F
MKNAFQLLFKTLTCSALLISVNGCEGWLFEKAAYGGVSFEGEPLKLLVLQKPLTYQRLNQLENGYEFEILQQFATDMGYKLKIQTVRNEKALSRELAMGQGDLAAGRFSEFSLASNQFTHSAVYDEEKTSLVCRQETDVRFGRDGRLDPSSRWKLLFNPKFIESRWAENLKSNAPQLKLSARTTLTILPILRSLSQGKGDCTLMDHLEAQYYLRVYPDLKIAKDISPLHSYFFLISKTRPELAEKMRKWMGHAARHHVLSQAKARIKGDISELTTKEIARFIQARTSVFPRYASLFRKHGQSFGIPWQLAAAVAYQESKWDPAAQSFTGVKGFMQLTQETAEHLGVEDRTDTEQSIWGGTKYLKMLLDRQPKGLPFREKLALALATYNVGPAHMIDAQKLAHKLGKNPYSWKDLQEVLPLLGEKDYLADLKYGPARGQEPVDYVQRVFAYLDLISVQI